MGDFTGWVWTADDVARLQAAHRKRFGEAPPRTETLFAVAAEGIRIFRERAARQHEDETA